jgi:hypothetical protein
MIHGNLVMAQTNSASITLPNVVLLDIEPSASTIYLNFEQPTEAGSATVTSSATDNSKWLNYTSANATSTTRKITVQISSGSTPNGTVIDLTASSYSGSGDGVSLGTPGATLQLSGTSQNLITNISSCYTGDGQNNGHRLTYTFRITDYANIKTVIAGSMVINYTIVDN